MNFQDKDLEIKSEYRSLVDNIVLDFYVPLLSRSILYKRAVGYFSSSSLVQISRGIVGLIKNDGKIQLIASPYLSEEDIYAIETGYKNRIEIIRNSLLTALKDPQNKFEAGKLNLLANLIANGQLDIKIAFTNENNSIGMYHEKMGILYDGSGNKISFSGSMNETYFAMRKNYETIDVFCSWKNDGENKRIEIKELTFDSIWSNNELSLDVIEFPEIQKEIIKKYKISPIDISRLEEENDDAIFTIKNPQGKTSQITIPVGINLFDYQKEAVAEWKKRNYRGIFDMATGTGKTITGLAGMVELYKHQSGKLTAIIVCPFQHLVEQWVEDLLLFKIEPIIGYSSSSQKDWKSRLTDRIRDQKLGVKNSEFICFICTNATFASDFVQNSINKIRGDILLVVDEAHNFGAASYAEKLSSKFKYRLGLSATIERFGDNEGTENLYAFFGQKCIEYSLERAIEEKKLTPYEYHPVIVNLTEIEWEEYSRLTKEIGKCLIKDKKGGVNLNEKGKKLAIKRARLVAAARNKIALLKELITPYSKDSHILVYCGAASLLNDENADDDIDDDIRQIDAITLMLGNELKMNVSQFTSKEDIKEREILKKEFAQGENLQALIAIKCLDEGVNIPKIKMAFILASTTNPKEYIQRRGRVLRLAEGKSKAIIYDFVTLPRPLDEIPHISDEKKQGDLSLVKKEIARVSEFGKLALNQIDSLAMVDEICEAYGYIGDINPEQVEAE